MSMTHESLESAPWSPGPSHIRRSAPSRWLHPALGGQTTPPDEQRLQRAIRETCKCERPEPWLETSLAAGQAIALGGSSPGLAHVTSGMLKMVATAADGRRSILRLCLSGDVAPFHTSPMGTGSKLSFEAITGSTLTLLVGRHVDTLLEDSAVAVELLGLFARAIRSSHDRSTQQILEDGQARTAAILCGLADRMGQRERNRIVVAHKLTQEELAHLSGVTRETIGRALRGFKARGWLLTGKQSFTILDETALRRRARLPLEP